MSMKILEKYVGKFSESKLQKRLENDPFAFHGLEYATLKHHDEATRERLVEKAVITTGLFDIGTTGGGKLKPKQQTSYLKMVRNFTTMIGKCRIKNMTQRVEEIDKMWVGEPITKPATEGATTGQVKVNPSHNKTVLDVTSNKIRSDWEITTETMQDAISNDTYEEEVFDAYMMRSASDMELLAIQGDTTAGSGSPTALLKSVDDGWYVKAQSSHVIDASGAPISASIWTALLKALPQEYHKPGLEYFASTTLVYDWMEQVSNRATNLGDVVLSGGRKHLTVFGIPVNPVEYIPSDLSVAISTAKPAFHQGVLKGPFTFTQTDTFVTNVNAGGLVSATFTAGVYTVGQVVKTINDALAAASQTEVFGDNGFGQVFARTPSKGATQTVLISGVVAATLGMTVGGYSGAAAGSNTDSIGSFIMLTNPKNLLFGMYGQGLRIYSEYLRETDKVGVTTFNQVDMEIENDDAVSLCQNVTINDSF